MTDYNALLIIGGVVFMAAFSIPEVYFSSKISKVFFAFIGYTIVMLGFQRLLMTIISGLPNYPPMDFANRMYVTTLVIATYLFVAYFMIKRIFYYYRINQAP